MIANQVKARLAAGETVVGCFLRSGDSTLAEFAALQGWDFLVFDGEHGTLHPGDIADLARAAELHGVTPLARVTTNDPSTILRFLDAGTHGVHVPWVNSAAGAERVVQSVKYGPRGIRGVAGNRLSGWTVDAGSLAAANRESLVVVHIETAEAVEAIDEFVEVDGIDVLFIGPTDLSHSLGVTGEMDHPRLIEAMEKVAAAVVPSPVTLGMFASSPATVRAWREKGARYFTTGLEPLLRPAMRKYLEESRD